MDSATTLSRLVQILYSAASAPELWPHFLEQLVQTLGISASGIVYQDAKRVQYGFNTNARMEVEELRVYKEYFGKTDPWVPPIGKVVPGVIEWGAELCAPEQLKKTAYFHDFARKFDRNLLCAIPTAKGPECIEAVTLYTTFKALEPSDTQHQLISLLVPHLQSALQLRRRFIDLSARSKSLEAALHAVSFGVVLFGRKTEILLMNDHARTLLSRSDGLRHEKGRLVTSSRAETALLTDLVARAVSRIGGRVVHAGGSMLVKRKHLRPLSLTATPLTDESDLPLEQACAVLFIHDPEDSVSPPEELLRKGFGLTIAETKLAMLLVEGLSLRESADRIGTTYNTVRSQLKSIFAKTGVNHQGKLIRVLLSNHLCPRSE